jgi:radical SAM protein with 4Fe4S-binding SPASM domain
VDLRSRLRLPENIVIKEKDGKFLALNPNVPSWLLTNQVGVLILRLLDGSQSLGRVLQQVQQIDPLVTEADFLEFMVSARKARLFETGGLDLVAPRFPLRAVYLNVTEACNLRCSYCYAEERQKSPKDKNLQLDDYRMLLDGVRSLSEDVTVHFTGGEPLKFPSLFDLARYSRSLGFRTFLLTNGTLIRPDNVAEIADLFGDIKVSLDGASAAVNDATRGEGSFGAITAGLALLDEIGKPYRITMTVTRRNLGDIANMVKKFGSRLNLSPYFPKKEETLNRDLAISGSEYFEAMRQVVGVNPYSEIGSLVAANLDNRTIQRCSIADGTLSVAANGDVYPCQLLHFDEFNAGNIRETPIEEVYRQSPVLQRLREHTVDKIQGCRECAIALLCGGGCIARHYYENGTINVAGAFCEYEQLAIPDALIDLYQL